MLIFCRYAHHFRIMPANYYAQYYAQELSYQNILSHGGGGGGGGCLQASPALPTIVCCCRKGTFISFISSFGNESLEDYIELSLYNTATQLYKLTPCMCFAVAMLLIYSTNLCWRLWS